MRPPTRRLIGVFAEATCGVRVARPLEARSVALVMAVLALTLGSPGAALAGEINTTRASVDTNGRDPNAISLDPSLSSSGRFVAFSSLASDLVAGDGNAFEDVFVRDLLTDTTVRASVDVGGGDANGASEHPWISADGRYVAFQSEASDLVAGDGNGFLDVFVRDLLEGVTIRVSVDAGGGDANLFSFQPSTSADGRYVAFVSSASDLVGGDDEQDSEVFVRDLQAGTTTRVSVDAGGGDPEGDSFGSVISADGAFVAFYSDAADLVAGEDQNADYDVFVRDLAAGATARATVDAFGGDSNDDSYDPSISGDGRYVAFYSVARDLVVGDHNHRRDVFVRDLEGGVTTRVSVDADGEDANDDSNGASISGDGRYVAFESAATDLVEGDTGTVDVFVRDLQEEVTVRASVSLDGDGPNRSSFEGAISADGQSVAFSSAASDLVRRDRNRLTDVFVRSGLWNA